MLTLCLDPSLVFGLGAVIFGGGIFCLGASYGAMTQRGFVMAQNGNYKEAGASCLVSLVTLPLFFIGFPTEFFDQILYVTAASWLVLLSLSGIYLLIYSRL